MNKKECIDCKMFEATSLSGSGYCYYYEVMLSSSGNNIEETISRAASCNEYSPINFLVKKNYSPKLEAQRLRRKKKEESENIKNTVKNIFFFPLKESYKFIFGVSVGVVSTLLVLFITGN